MSHTWYFLDLYVPPLFNYKFLILKGYQMHNWFGYEKTVKNRHFKQLSFLLSHIVYFRFWLSILHHICKAKRKADWLINLNRQPINIDLHVDKGMVDCCPRFVILCWTKLQFTINVGYQSDSGKSEPIFLKNTGLNLISSFKQNFHEIHAQRLLCVHKIAVFFCT